MKLLPILPIILFILTLIGCVPETNKKCKDNQILVNGSCVLKEPAIVVSPTPTIAPVPTPTLIPTVQSKLSCESIPHNGTESRIAYSASSVPYGQNCSTIQQSQTRTCSNGTWSAWSGTYTNLTCSVAAASSCGNIASGEGDIRVRYQTATVPPGSNCVSEIQTALCINGQLGSWSGTYTQSQCIRAEDYPLEIIQPVSGLSTSSRFYKAYPSLEYNVKVAVVGGKYPYQYALTTHPSGMTINAATGIISWVNPTTIGSPHNVAVRVNDSALSQQSVSWTITVTTSGFYFVDAINGSNNSARGGNGTGTVANPWKDMQDFYGGPTNISTQSAAKNNSSYAGGFVYFYSGTYQSSAMPSEDGWRVPFVANNKPQIWLAYPGNTPVISLTGAVIEFYGGGDNFYVDGIHFRVNGNERARGVRLGGATNNVTFIRNIFDGDGMIGSQGGNNAILMGTGGPNTGDNDRWVIAHNRFIDTGSAMGLEGYSTNKLLLEGNIADNINGHVFYPKMGTTNWHIRGNKIINCTGTGINVGNYNPSGNINIYYNYIQMKSGYAIHLNEQSLTTSTGPFRVYRNTLSGNVLVNQVESTNGPFYFTDNVIINGTSGDKITKNRINYPSNLIVSGTLGATSGVIDEEGLLIGAYSSHLGTTGWQFENSSTPLD